MKRINIDQINFNLSYEGYYWYSNSKIPVIKNKILLEDFTELPFIIEGNFYSHEHQISLNIKYIDGGYKIFQVELKNLPAEQVSEEKYIAHNLDGVKKVKMIQYWKQSEPDKLLEGMTTLVPSWQAFKGFEK